MLFLLAAAHSITDDEDIATIIAIANSLDVNRIIVFVVSLFVLCSATMAMAIPPLQW